MSFDPTRPFQRLAGKRPFVLGHRGARAHCPENTILAFERALSDGADGVELDVRMSADGQLVIAHDETVVTPWGSMNLGQLSGSQIKKLATAHGEPIPTLEEVLHLQARTGAYMNIELKGDVRSPIWMAKRAAEIIKGHGGSGIFLSSFSALQVFTLSRALPDVPVALLFDQQLPWATCSGKVPGFLAQLQDGYATLLRSKAGVTLLGRGMSALGARGAHPKWELVDRQSILELRRHVPVINTWTVNSPEQARVLSELGVDAIITDDPGLIRKALETEGKSS